MAVDSKQMVSEDFGECIMTASEQGSPKGSIMQSW
jgi:hypothetical protein